MATEKANAVIGIDLGGTTVKLGLFEPDGGGRLPVCAQRKVIPTRTENNGERILADIADAVLSLAGKTGRIDGIGIGVPGPVVPDSEGRMVVNGCVNLNWPHVVDVIEELGSMTGISRICLLNDANAAALGEYRFGGEAKEDGSAVMVTLGTGIGGGIVAGGRIITGAFGAAGEIGHMPINPDSEFLRALREKNPSLQIRGDWEYYASATGIARFARLALDSFDTHSLLRSCQGPVTAKMVFDAAKEDDSLALSVAQFFFDTLGQGLACVSSVIDPDLYIIGGGVAGAGEFLLNGVSASYRQRVFPPSSGTGFTLAKLGADAGLLGAAAPLL